MFGDFRHQHMHDYFYENLARGIKEGVYRSDINIPVIVELHILQTKIALESASLRFKGCDAGVVHEQFIRMFLFGIASLKGHKLINNYLNIKENYPLKIKIA
jgi:hypothetical protein